MGFTGGIEDRLAIRELYNTYSDATTQGDRAGWLACWAEDGRWVNRMFDLTGHAELAAQWDVLMRDFRAFAFFAEVGMIAVDGDTAKARATTREIAWMQDGSIRKYVGIYTDQLVRKGGNWRFARRDFTLLIGE